MRGVCVGDHIWIVRLLSFCKWSVGRVTAADLCSTASQAQNACFNNRLMEEVSYLVFIVVLRP
jgi:hypothetical protein